MYSISRIALFVAVFGILTLIGARGIVAVAIALVISGLASYVLLSRQRDAVSTAISARSAKIKERMEQAASAEDAADDEARRLEQSGQ